MASKTKVMPQKKETLEREGPETSPDSPLIDRNASVKALIRTAKKRGYVTDDQINGPAADGGAGDRARGCDPVPRQA
jgi:hypothetical protein